MVWSKVSNVLFRSMNIANNMKYIWNRYLEEFYLSAPVLSFLLSVETHIGWAKTTYYLENIYKADWNLFSRTPLILMAEETLVCNYPWEWDLLFYIKVKRVQFSILSGKSLLPKMDVFVFKDEIHILTSSWFTKVNVKDVDILLVMYALNTSLFSVFILLVNFGPIPTNNSLKRLQISWGSVPTNNRSWRNLQRLLTDGSAIAYLCCCNYLSLPYNPYWVTAMPWLNERWSIDEWL